MDTEAVYLVEMGGRDPPSPERLVELDLRG